MASSSRHASKTEGSQMLFWPSPHQTLHDARCGFASSSVSDTDGVASSMCCGDVTRADGMGHAGSVNGPQGLLAHRLPP